MFACNASAPRVARFALRRRDAVRRTARAVARSLAAEDIIVDTGGDLPQFEKSGSCSNMLQTQTPSHSDGSLRVY